MRLVTVSATVLLLMAFSSPADAAAEESASRAYLSYRTALATAKSLEDILPLLSQETRDQVRAQMKELQIPDDEALELYKALLAGPPDLEVSDEEEQTGGRVRLRLRGRHTESSERGATTFELSGTVTMVKEDGTWKVGEQLFESKPVVE